MANYSPATTLPAVEELRTSYPNQDTSSCFSGDGLSICRRAGIHVEDLTKAVTDYLLSSAGAQDLAVVMNYLNERYHLGLAHNNTELYKAVKALPHFSVGRIGYTHGRRCKGITQGVFVFLFY